MAAGDDDDGVGITRLEQGEAHCVAPGTEHTFGKAMKFMHDPQALLVFGNFEGAVPVDYRRKMNAVAHRVSPQRFAVG
jgi:hypothetical protein